MKFFGSLALKAATIGVAAMVSIGSAWAEYPDRPVRLILPYPAGGGVDANGRLLAKALSEMWKVPVVVENMAGAQTTLATKAVINAKPDGYTLGVVTSRLAINPAMYKSMPYTSDDFKPVTQLLTSPIYILSNPKAPFANFAEMLKYAKEHPNAVTVATSGPGDITSLPIEILNRAAGIELKQVPYIGGAASLTATISGEVDLTMSVYPVFKSMYKESRVKAVAVAGSSRSTVLPDVPTIKEAVPSFSGIDEWYGVIAPKALPAEILDKLHQDIIKALATKELKDRFLEDGNIVVGSSPDQFAAFLKAQTEAWKKPISDIGLSMELK